MKNIVASRAADACDVAVTILKAGAALVDTRVFASRITQFLDGENAGLRPIELPAGEVLRGAASVGRRSIGEGTQRKDDEVAGHGEIMNQCGERPADHLRSSEIAGCVRGVELEIAGDTPGREVRE